MFFPLCLRHNPRIMRVFENTASFKKDPKRPLVLALGNFDGIHLGHQKLLNHVVSQARRLQGQAAVFTFREHPQAILHPLHAPESLQSLEQRLELFRRHGIEVCFLQHFDRRFAALSANDFVKKILVKQLAIREICLGYNARFGRGREGDADLLRRLGKNAGFEVFQAKPVVWRGAPISSTAVRETIRAGKVDAAKNLLGRPWSLSGKVIRGESRGKKLGFPTANVGLNGYVRPLFGVYAVQVALATASKTQPARYKGVLNFGLRPTFGGTAKPLMEVHLFNFNKNIYGKKIEISFIRYLRDEKKFDSPEVLKKQIQKDIHSAKKTLNKIQ